MIGISVVVVCYNSEKIIEKTLEQLFSQEVISDIHWEIILVNNNSTDHTVEKAQNVFQNYAHPAFRIVNEKKPGTAFARFKGFSEAKYDIICFIDDDNRVPNYWIEKASGIMQNQQIGILGCGAEVDFETSPPEWFYRNQEAYAVGSLYPNDKLVEMTFDANLPTAGMCIRKEVFQNLTAQNWQTQLSGRIGKSQAPGEDSELCQAARLIGYKTFYTNEISFKHYMPKDRIEWKRFLEMTYGFGVTDVFLLPYYLIYDLRQNKNIFQYNLRKIWWINYLAKKVKNIIITTKFKLSLINKENFQIAVTRNQAFCDTILAEKVKFNKAFDEINKLKDVC